MDHHAEALEAGEMISMAFLKIGRFRPILESKCRRSVELEDDVERIPDLRGEARSNVFLAATLYWSAGQVAVRVRNLSERGALLDGRGLPSRGVNVDLRRGSLSMRGEIAWEQKDLRGVRFSDPVIVSEWVRKPGNDGQRSVDHSIASIRNGQAAAQVPHSLPAQGRTEELGAMAQELGRICERLAASPMMTVSLGEELIRLDALAQRLLMHSRGQGHRGRNAFTP